MTESEVTVILLDTWFSASIQTRAICVWWLRSRTLKPYDLRLEWTFSLPKVWACMGFPGSSAGKESACKVGDPSSIPGLGRAPGEGIGYPLQYSWASLSGSEGKVTPAIQETWVRSLGWEDPLEVGLATHLSISAWRIPMDRGVAKSRTQLND